MGLNCYAVHTMLRGLKFHRDWRTRYLLVRPEQWQLEHETNFWFRMYEVLDRVDAEWALDDIAADDGGMKLLREIREGIFPYFYTVHPPPGSYEEHQEDQRRVQDLKDALGRSFREHGELPTFAQFYVCQRKTPPGPPAEDAIKPPKPVGPARTETEHYVVIQALTHDKNPVQGVRLELVLAGGEIRSAVTDQAGFARVERIRAERVIIRVTSIDGGFWKALDGGASQPSSQDSDFSWHKVAPGECLSRIAHQHGIKSWKRVWEHPKNEPLRKKRKSPHVLSPGDMVAMPRVNVHEIIRPTDATYAIEVEQGLLDLKLILGDHNGRPFKSQPYALRFFRDSVTPDRTGTTDGSGMLHEKVPMTVREVLVSLPDLGFAWPVSIEAVGALPVSATESLGTRGVPDYGDACAIQARLNALGIPAGAAGAWDEDTRQALLQLRRARGSDDHGPLNDDDLRALESFGV